MLLVVVLLLPAGCVEAKRRLICSSVLQTVAAQSQPSDTGWRSL
jgi:hypothetical protein